MESRGRVCVDAMQLHLLNLIGSSCRPPTHPSHLLTPSLLFSSHSITPYLLSLHFSIIPSRSSSTITVKSLRLLLPTRLVWGPDCPSVSVQPPLSAPPTPPPQLNLPLVHLLLLLLSPRSLCSQATCRQLQLSLIHWAQNHHSYKKKMKLCVPLIN